MLSSGGSPFNDLLHVGHFIIGEAFVTPIIEVVGVDVPSHALLIIVRVRVRCVISLVVKMLPKATHPLG
jgi:hypothetical protein